MFLSRRGAQGGLLFAISAMKTGRKQRYGVDNLIFQRECRRRRGAALGSCMDVVELWPGGVSRVWCGALAVGRSAPSGAGWVEHHGCKRCEESTALFFWEHRTNR